MKKYNVYGVGNALVDTLVRVDKEFLSKHNLRKGVTSLVNEETQLKVVEELVHHKMERRSGGSAANTIIGVANCGGTACYAGKVAADQNGLFYKKDMENAGVMFEVPPSSTGYTGTCLVMTTPDADRTMLTHLGVSTTLNKSDIHLDHLSESDILYVEGYLWDGESTKQASLFAMEEAKKRKIPIAFTYSDPFCVNRSREDFIRITKEYVDIAFCNHEEGMALSQTDNPEDAIRFISELCGDVYMTWGSEGAFICEEGVEKLITSFPVKAIDTNGAGDAFAAGVLYGLTHNYSPEKSCKWGNYVASRMVMEIGARLSYSLKGRIDEVLE